MIYPCINTFAFRILLYSVFQDISEFRFCPLNLEIKHFSPIFYHILFVYSLVHKSLSLTYQFSFFTYFSKVAITHLIYISFTLPSFQFLGVPKFSTCNALKSSNGGIFSLLLPTYQLSTSCLHVIIGNVHVGGITCKQI